jgi:ribosomal protein S12 methylthiotransferase accessory factor YcaO
VSTDKINSDAIRNVAERLTGLEFVHPPQAPGMTIAMALIRDPRDGAMMTVSGCNRNADLALAACAGEAAEFLAQTQPVDRGALPAPPAVGEHLLQDWLGSGGTGEFWFPATGLLSGTQVAVPAALCRYDAASAHLDISTGCAAGASHESACHHALCEIVERDASARWKAGICRPAAIDMGEQPALWLAQARQGLADRTVRLLDIGAGAIMPVIAAVSFDPDGRGFVRGVSAHPDSETAAIGALREMIQMEFGLLLARFKRDRNGMRNLQGPDLEHLQNAEAIHTGSPLVTPDSGADCPFSPDRLLPAAPSDDIARGLVAGGHEVLVAVLSGAPGLHVVKLFVTGMPPPVRSVS